MLVLGGYIRAQATSKRQDGRCKRPVNPCDISNRSPPSFTGKVGRQSRGTGSSRWMTELALALESPDSLWDHLERGGGEGQSGQWGLRGGPAVQTCCSRAAAREPWRLRPEPTCPPWPPFLAPGPASPAPPENSRKWGGNNGRKCSGKRRPHPCQPRHLRRQGDLGQEGPLVISSLNVLLDLEVLPPPTPVTGLGTSPLEELGGLHKPPPLGGEAGGRTAGCLSPGLWPYFCTTYGAGSPRAGPQNCSGRPNCVGRTPWGAWMV